MLTLYPLWLKSLEGQASVFLSFAPCMGRNRKGRKRTRADTSSTRRASVRLDAELSISQKDITYTEEEVNMYSRGSLRQKGSLYKEAYVF